MDSISMMLLTVPFLLPTIEALDINLLWFGVFAVFMAEIGIITPPVGMASFVLAAILKDPEVNLGQRVSLGDVYIAGIVAVPIMLIFASVLIMFPDLVTLLGGGSG